MFTHVLGTGACSQERDTCTGTAIPCVPSALTHDDALSLSKTPTTLCSLCIQTQGTHTAFEQQSLHRSRLTRWTTTTAHTITSKLLESVKVPDSIDSSLL